jgi:hypothetical protein
VLCFVVVKCRVADSDLYNFPGSGSGSVSYSNEHDKINWRENLTKFAFWLGPVDLLTRKIKLRCIKSTVLGTLPI